jgi:hypothetical protein
MPAKMSGRQALNYLNVQSILLSSDAFFACRRGRLVSENFTRCKSKLRKATGKTDRRLASPMGYDPGGDGDGNDRRLVRTGFRNVIDLAYSPQSCQEFISLLNFILESAVWTATGSKA